jgi:chaperonin cofactor prefoldin
VPSTNGGVLVIPGPAETSQDRLDERLRRLEAEVSSLASQVQSQNERIGRR